VFCKNNQYLADHFPFRPSIAFSFGKTPTASAIRGAEVDEKWRGVTLVSGVYVTLTALTLATS